MEQRERSTRVVYLRPPFHHETTCLVEPDGGRILLVDVHRQLALELTGVPHQPPPAAPSMILRREEERLDLRPGKPEEPHWYPLVRAKDPDLELGLRDLPDKREERGDVVSVKKSCVARTDRSQMSMSVSVSAVADRRMVMLGIAPFARKLTRIELRPRARECETPASGPGRDASWS